MDNIKHYNSKGELFDFANESVLVNANNLRDYQWSYEIENYKIKRIFRDTITKSVPFVICCDETKAIEIKNKFSKHFDTDIGRQKRGYFEINGYRLYGYLSKSVKTDYLKHKRILYVTIEFTSDMPYWVKENVYHINNQVEREISPEAKHYAYTYSYKYDYGDNFFTFNNDSVFECDFRMIVFGSCNNPVISINGVQYKVNVSIPRNGYLAIDSRDRTIQMVNEQGYITNCFNKRDKTIEIFKKIPSGSVKVMFESKMKIDLSVFEERSEPKWN